MDSAAYILTGLAAAGLLWVLIVFNRLVRLRNHCREAWSNIDTELKRRYDLIPNLVAAVRGYAAHEKGVFEEVARLRAECVRATGSPLEQARPENELVRALNRLIAVAESYPELRAADGFLRLQEELANTEDRLQAARRFYNGNVREINNLVQTVPSNLIANLFGFKGEEFFEVEGAAVRHAPVVDMGRQGGPPQSALNLKE